MISAKHIDMVPAKMIFIVAIIVMGPTKNTWFQQKFNMVPAKMRRRRPDVAKNLKQQKTPEVAAAIICWFQQKSKPVEAKLGLVPAKTKNSGSKKMLVYQKLKAVVAKIGLVNKIKIVELHPFWVRAGTG